MMKVSKRDMALIRCLRNNSRATLTQVSKRTQIPISTLYDRLKAHEGNLLSKHTTLLDFSQLGYHARVQIFLKVPASIRQELQSYLSFHEHINNVFKITNGFDFLVEGIFEQVRDVQEFLSELESRFDIKDHSSHYIVDEVKREGFLSLAS